MAGFNASPKYPSIDATGVRISWLAVEINSACWRSSAFSLVISRKTTIIPSPSLPTGELTIDTRMRFSELVIRNNLSLCVGLLDIKAWATGLSISATSLPSEDANFKTLFQFNPSASP